MAKPEKPITREEQYLDAIEQAVGSGGGGDTIEAERIYPIDGRPSCVQITIHHADGSPDTVTEVYDGPEGPEGPEGPTGPTGPEGPSGGVIIDLANDFTALAAEVSSAFQTWLMSAIQAGGSETVVSVASSNTSDFLTRVASIIDMQFAIPSIFLFATLFVPSVVNSNEWAAGGKFSYQIENVGRYMLRAQFLIMSGAIEISGTATSWTAPTT